MDIIAKLTSKDDKYACAIADEKPITARQCIKALAQIGQTKRDYVPQMLLNCCSDRLGTAVCVVSCDTKECIQGT